MLWSLKQESHDFSRVECQSSAILNLQQVTKVEALIQNVGDWKQLQATTGIIIR